MIGHRTEAEIDFELRDFCKTDIWDYAILYGGIFLALIPLTVLLPLELFFKTG